MVFCFVGGVVFGFVGVVFGFVGVVFGFVAVVFGFVVGVVSFGCFFAVGVVFLPPETTLPFVFIT